MASSCRLCLAIFLVLALQQSANVFAASDGDSLSSLRQAMPGEFDEIRMDGDNQIGQDDLDDDYWVPPRSSLDPKLIIGCRHRVSRLQPVGCVPR